MSVIDTPMPSRANVMSVIGKLEGLHPPGPVAVPAPESPPAQQFESGPAPAVDVPVAAVAAAFGPEPVQSAPAPAAVVDPLRQVTIERDAWRAAAEDLRADLRRSLESVHADLERQQTQANGLALELEQLRQYSGSMQAKFDEQNAQAAQQQAILEQQRAELQQQRSELAALRLDAQNRDQQMTHLTAAITSLIDLAQSRVADQAAQPVEPAAPLAQSRTLRRGGYDFIDETPGSNEPLTLSIPRLAPDLGPTKTVRLGAHTPKARPVRTGDEAAPVRDAASA